jgi:hypothetical protein
MTGVTKGMLRLRLLPEAVISGSSFGPSVCGIGIDALEGG